MIHRINSVAPDLDDRVIKPNQARSAINMRFGASDGDSNLSGGILVNGNYFAAFNNNINPYKAFNIPNSDSNPKVIGSYLDYETNSLFVAIYRTAPVSNPTLSAVHQIVRIKTETDTADIVVQSPYLNFSLNHYVSMTVISGLLYWTDNYNEPRMINIEKGVITYNGNGAVPPVGYPDIFYSNTYLWTIAQIKPNPSTPLKCEFNELNNPPTGSFAYYWFTSDSTSGYENKWWISSVPYQFSYYYVFDNNEESRLAPWSEEIYTAKRISLTLDGVEIEKYIYKTTVKEVVFVMRQGNEGVVYNIQKYLTKDWPAPVIVNDSPIYQQPGFFCENLEGVSKTPTPASVYNQRYDSVPLLSKTNTIANNILNHANAVVGYNDYGTIKIDSIVPQQKNYLQFVNNQDTTKNGFQTYDNFRNHKTFRPSSTYSVGLQLIDFYGRCTDVFGITTVTIPDARVIPTVQSSNYLYANQVISDRFWSGPNPYTPSIYKDDAVLNAYNIKVTLSGQLPAWAKEVRFAMSKNNDVVSFHKTICRLYYWYQNKTGENKFIKAPNKNYSLKSNANGSLLNIFFDTIENSYSFKGYGIELIDETPFVYNEAENQYIKISREYVALNDDVLGSNGNNDTFIEYKIVGQSGRVLLLNEDLPNVKFYSAYNLVFDGRRVDLYPYYAFYYQVEIFTKKTEKEIIYYDVISYNSPSNNPLEKIIEGDCYITYFKKTFLPQTISAYSYESFDSSSGKWKIVQNKRDIENGYIVYGYFYSMNITNINQESWNSSYGLENVANTGAEINTSNPYAIVFSDSYVRGTQINGLNKFNPLNIRQAPTENGPITSLTLTMAQQGEPGVLLAIGEFGITSFYFGAVQLTNVDGTSNLATTDQHLSSQRPLIGQFGTTQQQSISKTTFGAVYWWSDVVQDFIRYSRAGLERLGLTYSFNNQLRSNITGVDVTTGYDFVMDEVILTPRRGNSFVFSERYKTFQGYRNYYDSLSGDSPEAIIGVSDKTYFFLNGQAYISDRFSNQNEFFGTTYNPTLTVVTNEYPSVIKQWNSIKIFGPKPLETTLKVGSAEGFYYQTYIQPNWWIKRKGEYDAAIRRVENQSPSSVMAGKIMESRILYSTFVFDALNFGKLNFIEIKSNIAVVQ